MVLMNDPEKIEDLPIMNSLTSKFARPLISLGLFKPRGRAVGAKVFLVYCIPHTSPQRLLS